MALETKLYHKLAQQLVMTPQLQQAIKMLQLSKFELIEAIQQELEENPVLEEDIEAREEAEEGVTGTTEEKIVEEDWDSYLSGSDFDKPASSNNYKDKGEETSFENFTPQKTTLSEHLLWQLKLSEIDRKWLQIGEALIGNINEDGYLDVTPEEIANNFGVSKEDVEKALSIIQDFDPPGVGARDLKECLLIQVRALGAGNSIIEKIITDHLSFLEKRDCKGLARALKLPEEDVKLAVKVICGLEPKPGRPFQQELATYIIPDIYVFKVGNEYVAMPNESGIPRLKLSEFYRNSLRQMGKGDTSKEYIQEKVRAGSWFIKSIQQRQRTICKVMESIIKFQKEFLDKGIRHLKPLVLRDVAEDIGMHESTISRVTTNKYAHTPQGIFELKYFFGGGLNCSDGEAAASESVKDMIKNIIEGEDPKKPYSDDSIAELLRKSRIEIARRTVTKYREAMKVPSSSKRARGF